MINIYDSKETKFSHNGICSLDEKRELIKCTIHRKLEGAYEGTLFISKENLKWTEFIEGRILKLPVDINGRTQLFRIFDTSDDFNDLEVYFKHIFFDLDDFFIEDTNIVEKDGRGAINQILNTTIDSHRFTATSDINITNNCRIVDKTVTEAIGVDENCFLNRWGGEIDYDNFKFRINEKIGSDNGYRIALRKNLKAINGDISITEVATKLKVKGYDGIELDEYLISPLANAYPHFKTRVVKFDDIKVKSDPNNPEEEGYETLQAAKLEMKRRGLELFSKQNIDKPTVNFEIDIDEMREENIEVGVLEVLSIGDIATLELEDFLRSNIEVKQRVIELEFDCIRKINIKVILGGSTSTIFKEVSKIESMLNDLNDKLEGNSWQDILDQSMGQATDIIAEGFKDSHVIPRKNEIIVADNIDLNLAKKVIVINKNGIGFSLNGYRPDRLTLAMTIDGEINASCINFGSLRGYLIDARNLTVTDGNGKRTLDIDSFGRVRLDVTELSILSKAVETEENSTAKVNKAKADFKVTVDAITQKVIDVESSTNEQLTKHENRISSAEEKITSDAIINTVSATVNQAKNDAISVSSKEISKVEQKVDEVTYSFQDISNENLLNNSSFEKEETYSKNHPFILDRLSGGDGYPASIDGGKYLRLYTEGSDSYFIKNTSIKIKPNTYYTISFYYCCTQSVDGSNYVFINGNPVRIPTRYIGDRVWHRTSYTFRTNANIDGITGVRFGLVAQGSAWLLLDNIQIEEGKFVTKWKAKKNELCTGISFIDAGGMGVRHEDGSFTKMTAKGFKRYISSNGYDYHYLTYTGKTQKLNTNPVTIQLPDDFKGKDFKVSLSLEEIANPAGWFIQSVQLLVGNVNKANGTFQILGGSQSQFHDGTQGTMKPTTISYVVTA